MDKFIKFFTSDDEDDEEEIEYQEVDPVIEARRKEKFSAPLIYDEEDTYIKDTSSNNNLVIQPKNNKKVDKNQHIEYEMKDIISPFSGVEKQYSTQKEDDKTPISIPKVPKRKSTKSLTQVVSPFYGIQESHDDIDNEPMQSASNNQKKVDEIEIKQDDSLQLTNKTLKPVNNIFEDEEIDHNEVEKRQKELEEEFSTGQITQSIRNLSKMIAEEEQNLKIVEQKTGEFKLELDSKEDSLIDNVEDTMSLDDLMSLYETKFKD